MKIIFDTEEEKQKFFEKIKSKGCPFSYGFGKYADYDCENIESCIVCWMNTVPHRVKLNLRKKIAGYIRSHRKE